MCVGGVSSQGENSPGEGVGQGHRGDEGRLGGDERGLHGRHPGRTLGYLRVWR